MKKKMKILRYDKREKQSFWQTFLYETDDEEGTFAKALNDLNQKEELKDIEGNLAKPIKWECSCLQAKCGACAMLIDGMPQLACDTKLNADTRDCIELMPLEKFPVVEDLIVDRKVMFDNLERLRVWMEDKTQISMEDIEDVSEASRCLQCGCCLEICTSFFPGSEFAGTASLVPMARVLRNLPKDREEGMQKAYQKYIFEGCEKYNACHHVCPAGIDIARIMAHTDAAAAASETKRKNLSLFRTIPKKEIRVDI